MFNLFKSKKSMIHTDTENSLASVADGKLIKISDVPDEVFSQKILGDGYAIHPTSGSISSPVNGTITQVYDTGHAYCITSDDGLEILVHMGIDTVELKGKGFSAIVKDGDKVLKGSPLATMDMNLIESLGYKTVTMVVITNTIAVKSMKLTGNSTVRAGDAVLTYKL